MKNELQLLKEANDILRSISAIIDRKGKTTNWEGINKVVKMALAEQHELLLAKNCYISDVSFNEAEYCTKCGKRKRMKGDGTIELLCECSEVEVCGCGSNNMFVDEGKLYCSNCRKLANIAPQT